MMAAGANDLLVRKANLHLEGLLVVESEILAIKVAKSIALPAKVIPASIRAVRKLPDDAK